MSALPYVTAPGSVEKALRAIRTAATPPVVSQDFVKTILGVSGGSGNQITAYLKKIGFAGADGKPTDLYRKFRNPATEGLAAAEALKIGYSALYTRNEYMHKLNDEQLRGLIVEETGASTEANTVSWALACIKGLKKFAKWTGAPTDDETAAPAEKAADVVPAVPAAAPFPEDRTPATVAQSLRLNLGYTINLNLPATSDPAVFNAIFKALKDHLLESSK